MFAKFGPPRGSTFGCQNWSGGTSFGKIFAKIGPGGPILGGTNFGVTGREEDITPYRHAVGVAVFTLGSYKAPTYHVEEMFIEF